MIKDKLKYVDERDKSFGIAGMAISIVALDGEQYLESLSIDAPLGHSVELSEDFYFTGNPRLSAKIAWNEMLRHFRISSGMLISNAVCRNYVQHRRKLSKEIVELLKSTISQVAIDSCSLEQDECDDLFEKDFAYFDNLFSYARVHEIATQFADEIVRKRSMSAPEIIEQLRQLSLI